MTLNVMVTDEAQSTSAYLATGSVVQGDWLYAYQTNTDDMFGEVKPEGYTAGSFGVQRLTAGSIVHDDRVVGIALNNASSGDSLSVAHEGLFIGTAGGDYNNLEEQHTKFNEKGPGFVNPFAIPKIIPNIFGY